MSQADARGSGPDVAAGGQPETTRAPSAATAAEPEPAEVEPGAPAAIPPSSPAPSANSGPSAGPAPQATAPRSNRVAARRERSARTQRRLLVAAAAIVGVAFGAGVTAGLRSPMQTTPSAPVTTGVAAAALAPPGGGGATGSARLLLVGGQQMLRVQVTGLPEPSGFYEVWLAAPGSDRMIALGALSGDGDVDLPVPDVVDAHDFRVVELSSQPLSGAPGRGPIVLRGPLR